MKCVLCWDEPNYLTSFAGPSILATSEMPKEESLRELQANLRDALKKSGALGTVKAQIRKEFIAGVICVRIFKFATMFLKTVFMPIPTRRVVSKQC